MNLSKEKWKEIGIVIGKIVVLLLVAVLSFTKIAEYATSVEMHADTIEMLDDKKITAIGLTTAVTVVSTAISTLPNDTASPIANQLSEFASILFIVICVLYFEKFLLTTIGYISFCVLIPIGCILGCIYVLWNRTWLKELAVKLTVFGLIISLIIPTGAKVTMMIEDTFEESITQTFASVDEISDEAEKTTTNEDSNGFMEFISGVGNAMNDFFEGVKNVLNVFIDAIAVLVITACIIPIVVLFFFVWITKLILGIDIDVSRKQKKIAENN